MNQLVKYNELQLFLKRNIRLLITISIAIFCIISCICIWFFVLYDQPGGLAVLYKIGFFEAFGISIVSLLLFRKDIFRHPEKCYLVILLCITCMASWIYDTNEVSWDIESHYKYVLQYADPDRFYDYTEGDDSITSRKFDINNEIEQDLLDSIEISKQDNEGYIQFSTIYIWTDTNTLQIKDELLNELDSDIDDEQKTASAPLINLYQRVASLPASIIFFFENLINVPFTIKFISTRMIYAILYSLILFFGMKRLRSGKMLFAVISMYPTAIFLASNYSYDYWVNAWTMYGVASIVGELQRPNKQIHIFDCMKIIGSFFIGLGPKAIYFPIYLLCLLLPKSKFRNSKSCYIYRVVVLFFMLMTMASFLLPFLSSSGSNATDTRGGSDISSSAQLSYILTNPFEYLKTLFIFSLSYFSPMYSSSYITNFAYLGFTSIPIWIIVCIATIYTSITDTRYDILSMNNWKHRVFVTFVLLIAIFLAMTSLYISFTPVGLNTINGFQGRYILPVLFPFLIFMGTKKTFWPRSKKYSSISNFVVLGIMMIINYYSIWDVYLKFLF